MPWGNAPPFLLSMDPILSNCTHWPLQVVATLLSVNVGEVTLMDKDNGAPCIHLIFFSIAGFWDHPRCAVSAANSC